MTQVATLKAKPVNAVVYKPQDIVAAKATQIERKRNNMLKAAKGPKLKDVEQAKREARTAEFKAALDGSGPLVEPSETETKITQEADLTIGEALKEAADKGLLKEAIQAITGTTPIGEEPVTDDELAAALAVIARASKRQAEELRKAAVARKKVAPEEPKVKKAKELTDAQKAKLAKAEKAAEAYSVTASAAMGYVGKGLGESGKMQIALGLLSLPALRWLAKQYEGVSIPKDKRSALDIREFLRTALLGWTAPVKA